MSPRSSYVISLVSTVFFCKNQQVKLTSEFQSSSQIALLDLFITIAIIIVTINAVCLVTQLCPTLCDTIEVACQAPLPMGILKARILEWVAMPSSRGSSQPEVKPRSPTLQADSLPSEPPGKPLQILSLS